MENNIGIQQWKKHFRNLLEGNEEKEIGEKRQRIEKDQEITDEEIRKAIKKAKKRRQQGKME